MGSRTGKQTCGSVSIQVEEGHNLPHFLGFFTGLQQQATVMKCKADDLLNSGNDVIVTYPAATNVN